MKRYSTLASLDGLRVGVPVFITQMHAARLCTRQLADNTVAKCLRSNDVTATARVVSVMLQGINVTLVPLNDSSVGVWEPENDAFSGILGHIGADVDTTLESWGTLRIASSIHSLFQCLSPVDSDTCN